VWNIFGCCGCVTKDKTDGVVMCATCGSLLPVVLERMIGNRWKLLQKHCLFISVLCVSNLPRPQQMALSGTRFYLAGFSPSQGSYFKEPVAPSITRLDISRFLFYFGGYLYRNKPRTIDALKDDIRLEIANIENDSLSTNQLNTLSLSTFYCLQIFPYICFGLYKDHHQGYTNYALFTSIGSICHHMQSGSI
jgi:hypothetical protein